MKNIHICCLYVGTRRCKFLQTFAIRLKKLTNVWRRSWKIKNLRTCMSRDLVDSFPKTNCFRGKEKREQRLKNMSIRTPSLTAPANAPLVITGGVKSRNIIHCVFWLRKSLTRIVLPKSGPAAHEVQTRVVPGLGVLWGWLGFPRDLSSVWGCLGWAWFWLIAGHRRWTSSRGTCRSCWWSWWSHMWVLCSRFWKTV